MVTLSFDLCQNEDITDCLFGQYMPVIRVFVFVCVFCFLILQIYFVFNKGLFYNLFICLSSVQQKKYEYSLKSPGIKPTANRHGSSTKNSAIPPSLPKTSEEDDSSPSGCVTPTSPKPQSPSATSTVNNVFVNSPGQ